MKRSLRILTATCAAIALVGLVCLTGCSSETSEEGASFEVEQTVADSLLVKPGTLTVGLDCSYAPYAGRSSTDGQLLGINVDIAAAMADEMGLKVDYVDTSNSTPAELLEAGAIDVFFSYDKATSEGGPFYLGTYMYDATSLFAVSSSGAAPVVDLNNMAGKTIAVQENSVTSVTVANRYGSEVLSLQSSFPNVFGTLEAGGANYAASSGVVGKYMARQYADIYWVGTIVDTPTEIGIGANSTNVVLIDAVQNALTKIGNNGILNMLICKWIDSPITFPGYPAVSINKLASSSPAAAPAVDVAAAPVEEVPAPVEEWVPEAEEAPEEEWVEEWEPEEEPDAEQ